MGDSRLKRTVCVPVMFSIMALHRAYALTTPSPNAVDQFIPGVNIPDGTSGGWSLTPDDSFMVFPTATDKVTQGVIAEETLPTTTTPATTTTTTRTTTTTTTPSPSTTTKTTTTKRAPDTAITSLPIMHPVGGGGPNLVGDFLGNNFPVPSFHHHQHPPNYPGSGGYGFSGNIPWWLLLLTQEP